jgi:hypothetical protein
MSAITTPTWATPRLQYCLALRHWVAKTKKAAGFVDTNKWWNNTVDAFNKYKTGADGGR